MLAFLLVGIMAVTLTTSGHVSCNMDLFAQAGFDNMKYLPNNFQELSRQISPDRPLLLVVRTAEATHNNNEDFEVCWRAMKAPINNQSICEWSRDERLRYFDPEIKTHEGAKQISDQRRLLEITGWQQFLESMDGVQYLCSPLSRSIQMALHTMTNVKIMVDEGVKQRVTPFGPDLRRNFQTKLSLGDRSVESIQEKFHPYSDRLIFKMANLESDSIYDKFGYYSDEDPNIELSKMETEDELDERISKWVDMLRPDTDQQYLPSKVLGEWQTNEIAIRTHPKHFHLDAYKDQDYRPNFCEFIPIWLQFHSDPISNTSN